MWRENREYIDRMRLNPMSDQDYARAEKVLETLRQQRIRKSGDEEKLAEIAHARDLVIRRMEEYKRTQKEADVVAGIPLFDFGMWQEYRDYVNRLRGNPMTEEDYERAEKVLEALRQQRIRKDGDEEKLAEIARARDLVIRRMGEYERIQKEADVVAGMPLFDFGMWQEYREYINRLRGSPMTEEDYNKSDNVLESLRRQRERKSGDEAMLAEIARARQLALDRRAEYENS